MTEMYKTRNDLNPSFMQEIFCEKPTHYNLRNNNEFIQPRVRSVNNDSESVRLKVRSCDKLHHNQYAIQNPVISLKQR